MPELRHIAAVTDPRQGTRVLSRHARPALPGLPEALRDAVADCSPGRAVCALTRKEVAAVLDCDPRTVSRLEVKYGFRPECRNARVLRYPVEQLVGLVAIGAQVNRREAARLGLDPRAILRLAAQLRGSGGAASEGRPPPPPIGAEEVETSLLLKAWADPSCRRVLGAVVREFANVSGFFQKP